MCPMSKHTAGKQKCAGFRCLSLARERVDGVWYCGNHSPIVQKARRDNRIAKWGPLRKDRLSASAELSRRAACYDDSLAAMVAAEAAYTEDHPSIKPPAWVVQLRAAIGKARKNNAL